MLPVVRALRYVTPLREGGSCLMEADDEGTYVVKYRGAGQGPKALVAELLAGEIGRALGLPVPRAVLLDLDPAFARLERDPEIQSLLRASEGRNYALDFLPGSITYDPLVPPPPDAALAADVIWFDVFVTNADRTARERIDHGVGGAGRRSERSMDDKAYRASGVGRGHDHDGLDRRDRGVDVELGELLTPHRGYGARNVPCTSIPVEPLAMLSDRLASVGGDDDLQLRTSRGGAAILRHRAKVGMRMTQGPPVTPSGKTTDQPSSSTCCPIF